MIGGLRLIKPRNGGRHRKERGQWGQAGWLRAKALKNVSRLNDAGLAGRLSLTSLNLMNGGNHNRLEDASWTRVRDVGWVEGAGNIPRREGLLARVSLTFFLDGIIRGAWMLSVRARRGGAGRMAWSSTRTTRVSDNEKDEEGRRAHTRVVFVVILVILKGLGMRPLSFL